MNNVYKIVGLMAIIGLVIVAMTSMAAAAETIGDIEAYTPGYEEQSNNMRYASRNALEDDLKWSIEWEYNEPINGTIDTVMIRGRPAGGSATKAYVLYIDGENVGAPDDSGGINSANGGPSSTLYYWAWNNCSVEVDGKVVFEFASASSGINAYVYVGRSGEAVGADVDNDGDKTVGLTFRNPNGKMAYQTKIATEWTGKSWEKVSSDVIYEFTYTEGTSSEPVNDNNETNSTDDEVVNVEPNEPQLQSPEDGAEDIDPTKEVTLVAAVSDQNDDDLSVFFYLSGQSMSIGNYNTDSGIITHIIPADTLDYGTTYEWHVSVWEDTPDLYRADSVDFEFTTMDEPNVAPVAPTTVIENTIADGEELNVGDIFILGIPVNDEDGDDLVVRFYLKNGAVREIGNVTVSGSGNALIEVNSSGLAYNTTYTWWATIDDGSTIVETEHRTFSTSPKPMPETEDPFNWALLFLILIIIIIVMIILWGYRGKIKGMYIAATAGRKKQNGNGKTSKTKSSTKSTNGKKTKKAKKTKNAMARIKKTGTSIKKVTTTKISQVVVFGKFMKDSFILAYYSATTSTKIPDIDKRKTVKCPYCGNMAHLEKKRVIGKVRWYCDDCGRWRRDLNENQQPIAEHIRAWKKLEAKNA